MIAALVVLGSLILAAVLLARLARDHRRRQALTAVIPDWLDLDSEIIHGLDNNGWRPEHLRLIDHLRRTKPDVDPFVVRHFLFMSGMGFPPGLLPEHQLAWTAVIIHAEDGAWILDRFEQLIGPDIWEGRPVDRGSGKIRVWHQVFGSGLAPLVAAAGLTFDEARALATRGKLTEGGLRALAGLRGIWLPEYPPTSAARPPRA